MELQHILFLPSSVEVAAGLKEGVNVLKSEMVASLKDSVQGDLDLQTQAEIATVINKMFLDSRREVIETLRLVNK